MYMSQIIKNPFDIELLYKFLKNNCEIEKKYFIFSKIAFKKAKLTESVKPFIESLKPFYYKSKLKYLNRTMDYKNFITILRQLCNYFKLPYTSKILYQKSKYEIIYYINMSDYINIIETTSPVSNNIMETSDPKNTVIELKDIPDFSLIDEENTIIDINKKND